jgi:hypothetical protein
MRFRPPRHSRKLALVGLTALVGSLAASAAELPSRDAKKTVAQKTQICDIDGRPGFRLPGGETCMRISGYVSAGVTGTASKTH